MKKFLTKTVTMEAWQIGVLTFIITFAAISFKSGYTPLQPRFPDYTHDDIRTIKTTLQLNNMLNYSEWDSSFSGTLADETQYFLAYGEGSDYPQTIETYNQGIAKQVAALLADEGIDYRYEALLIPLYETQDPKDSIFQFTFNWKHKIFLPKITTNEKEFLTTPNSELPEHYGR